MARSFHAKTCQFVILCQKKVAVHNFAIQESFKEVGVERILPNIYQHGFTESQNVIRLLQLMKKETIIINKFLSL